jgi:DNA-binding MarR family transcriptional regulator
MHSSACLEEMRVNTEPCRVELLAMSMSAPTSSTSLELCFRLRRIDLAERMGLTASGVMRTLLPLEKIGLVGRESDPRNARVGHATLTPTGQELHGHALASAEAICREATQAVSDAQLASVLELLGQLAGINLSNA